MVHRHTSFVIVTLPAAATNRHSHARTEGDQTALAVMRTGAESLELLVERERVPLAEHLHFLPPTEIVLER